MKTSIDGSKTSSLPRTFRLSKFETTHLLSLFVDANEDEASEEESGDDDGDDESESGDDDNYSDLEEGDQEEPVMDQNEKDR